VFRERPRTSGSIATRSWDVVVWRTSRVVLIAALGKQQSSSRGIGEDAREASVLGTEEATRHYGSGGIAVWDLPSVGYRGAYSGGRGVWYVRGRAIGPGAPLDVRRVSPKGRTTSGALTTRASSNGQRAVLFFPRPSAICMRASF